MEIIIMVIMLFIVLTIALIAFINNRIEPNKQKVADLKKRIDQLESKLDK